MKKPPLYRLYFMLQGQRQYLGSTSIKHILAWETSARNSGATDIMIDPPLEVQEEKAS